MAVPYVYYCPECDAEFDARFPMGEAPEEVDCPRCGWTSERVLTMPVAHYKARGFTGAGRAGEGRVDHFCHKDGSKLTREDKTRVPKHYETLADSLGV